MSNSYFLKFSKREMEVCRLIAEGLDNIEIASRMAISPGTVSNHLSRIYLKMDIQDGYNARATLVRDFTIHEMLGDLPEQAEQEREEENA